MNPLFGLGASVLGSIFGGGQANAAARQQQQALALQQQIVGTQMDAYRQYQSAVADAVRQGAFDPNQVIAQADADNARTQGATLKNMAGAYATAGYRPGDTAIQHGLDASNERNQLAMDSQHAAIRQNALSSMLSAYAGLNQGSSVLNAGLSAAQGQQQTALAQQQQAQGGLAGLLSAAMPFMASNPSAPKTPVAQTVNNAQYAGQGIQLIPPVDPNTQLGGGLPGGLMSGFNAGGGFGMGSGSGLGGSKAFNGFGLGG